MKTHTGVKQCIDSHLLVSPAFHARGQQLYSRLKKPSQFQTGKRDFYPESKCDNTVIIRMPDRLTSSLWLQSFKPLDFEKLKYFRFSNE